MKTPLQAPSTAALTVATAVVALLAALLLGLVAPAWADPMRPLNPPAAAPPGPTPTAAAPTAERPTAPAWPPLLALRQDSDGRHQALFGDRWFGVGERLGAAGGPVLALIDGQRVQLRQGRELTTLHLLPPLRYSAAVAAVPVSTQATVAATPPPRRAAARSAVPPGPATPAPTRSSPSVSPSAPGR